MEQRSLLEKQRDVKDQRRTIVSITSKGKDLISKVGPTSEKICKQIEAEFGAYELDGLYRRLDLLITKLKKE
jgi:DNA-binding MarR family transcriptional regulator